MKYYNVNRLLRVSVSNLVFRNFYKILYKYTHSKSYKHNRHYWPYYNVERNSYGGIDKIFFKGKLIIDNSFPTIAKKKCMLVATGPSVKKIPYKAFYQHDMDYMGVNGAISLSNVKFKYYVIIDHNFTCKRFDLVLKVLQSDCIFFTTPRCLDTILRKVSTDDIRCKIKVVELITDGKIERFLGQYEDIKQYESYYFLEEGKGFSKHIKNAIFDYFTVAYVALQIIYSLEVNEIYLAGIDMNNFNQPRFYENNNNKQPTMLDRYLHELLPAFQVASKFMKKEKIQVYNLSNNSAITSFEKIDCNKNMHW